MKFLLPALLFCMSLSLSVSAQKSVEKFGKNRIQYKTFEWQYYSTENFDIHYYGEGKKTAERVAGYIEDEFEVISDIIAYTPYVKTKLFIYNSYADLQQSNVGLNEIQFTIGGQVNLVNTQVEIAVSGTSAEFKQELVYKVANMFIEDMMFGGKTADILQNAYLLTLADWFVDGAAKYIAYGWDSKMDDYMRDMFTQGKLKKLSKYEGDEATLLGQSIWNFLVQREGKDIISGILNLTRVVKNEERSIQATIGIPFKVLMQEWETLYRTNATASLEQYVKADPQWNITNTKRSLTHRNLRFSPDGKKLAYSRNQGGRYAVVMRDIATGDEKVILKGGYKLIDQDQDKTVPLVAWKDNKNLMIVDFFKGNHYMWQFNVESKDKKRNGKLLNKYEQIHSFDVSRNGRLAILSAQVKGQNDLYLYSISSGKAQRLTNDLWDDITPRFIPNSTGIVFSSNRTSDSLAVKTTDLNDITNNFNLFIYDVDTTENVLARLQNNLSKDFYPVPKDGNNIYYLSDQKGGTNMYRYDREDSVFVQTTNNIYDYYEYDIDFKNKRVAYLSLFQGREEIFIEDDFDLTRSMFTPINNRQIDVQSKFVTQRILKRNSETLLDLMNGKETEDEEKNVVKKEEIDPEARFDFEDVFVKSQPTETKADTTKVDPDVEVEAAKEEESIINTDNYVFDSEYEDEDSGTPNFLNSIKLLQKKRKPTGPHLYETRFTIDNLITTPVIDPLRGFGIQLEGQVNDLLENHKFYGGAMASTDFKSGNYFIEYNFLKYKLDFHARFDRDVIFRQTENAQQRYTLNKFQFGASLPLASSARLSVSPFFARTRYIDLNPVILAPGNTNQPVSEHNEPYTGARVELVYDNTSVAGLNIFEGTKAKLFYEHYQGLKNGERSFSHFNLDIRHYRKVHKEITLAGRLFYGRFYGNYSSNYLLGGMDNWIFQETDNEDNQNSPLYDETYQDNTQLLFVKYLTNLRGFNYNKFFGTNAMLLNLELRIPVIRYFYKGPISSNFFRNLQLVTFFDMGSAWTGSSPFAKSNDLNTVLIAEEGAPFQANIQNFSNPWLTSYGVGARTVLLGYYMKFDVAWPIENYNTLKPKLQVTLGYDF